MSDIKEIEGADSLNDLIGKMNDVLKEWGDVTGPITESKDSSMKSAGLDKTPGSNITHVMIGLMITMVADLNMSMGEVRNQIKFLEKEPYIQIGVVDKYKGLIEGLPAWF